jgi:PAS domain S-box-containing protein
LNDAVLIYDTEMNVLRANPSFLRTYGFDPVGYNVRDIIRRVSCRRLDGCTLHWEERPTPRALPGERVTSERFVVKNAAGSEMVVEASSSSLYAGDSITGSVTVWHDVNDRARAEESLRKSEARFKMLSETAGRLLESEDPRSVINELCTHVMEHLGCQVFFHFLADEEAGRLRLAAWAGIPEEEALKIEWLDYGAAVCGCAVRDASRIIAQDIADSGDPRTELVKSYGIQAYCCHPLLVQGRVIGTLSFGTTTRPRFLPDEIAIMKTVTNQVASAMQRVQSQKRLETALTEAEKGRQALQAREEELNRLNRTLTALSKSSQAIMHATDESEYLHEVCRIIVEDCGHAMTWVGYARDDEAKGVQPVASAGFDEGYVERLNITWADSERGRGPTGTAIRTGKVCLCRNMLTDPQFEPWRAEALRRGYASSIVLPLQYDDKVYGAITIYSREPDPFSEDEVRLLTELASDLSSAIFAIRLRKAHEEAQEALKVSLTKYKVLFDSFPLGISITDREGNIIETSREAARLLGIPKDEHERRAITGQEWRIIRPDGTDMPEDEYASVMALKSQSLVENVEMGIMKGAGDVTWINVTAAPIPLDDYGVAVTSTGVSVAAGGSVGAAVGGMIVGAVAERSSARYCQAIST